MHCSFINLIEFIYNVIMGPKGATQDDIVADLLDLLQFWESLELF